MGHSHSKAHAHDHGDHSHGSHDHAAGKSQSQLAIAAVLTGGFMIAEVAGGLISGSLALLADAGHMLTDFAALSLAWAAFAVARRPATWRHTFGFERFSVLAAFVNGLTLIAIAIWISAEAYQRFEQPGEILAGPMLWVAIGGLLVNCLVFYILTRGDSENLNMRGAILHVVGDLLGSVAAIAAALIIMATGWTPIDPLLSVLIAVIIIRSAWMLVREAGHILLQGAPKGLDRREIISDLMETIPELRTIDHVHIWSLTAQRPMITLEAYIDPAASIEPVNAAIKARLEARFHIDHATVDVMRQTD